MTERKPPGVSFESWVERQLREARERGSFDNLTGMGKPLPPTASDELAWVREKARRENLPVSALLPPALAVAKEVEDLPERLSRERSEKRVRSIVDELNQRIDAARRGPQVGPPVRTGLLDVEAVVAAWRDAHAPAPSPPPSPPVASPVARRLPRTRRAVRWAAGHGVPRLALRAARRAGDLQAEFVLDRERDNAVAYQDRVRATAPLHRGRLAFMTATHEVCREVLRSDDFGVLSADAQLPPLVRRLAHWAADARVLTPLDPPSLLAVEPPDHTRYRRLVSKVFTAKAVLGLRDDVQAVADELLDELAALPRGEPFDLVARYAMLLPVRVIAQILGVPAREHARLLAMGNDAAASLDLGLTWRDYRRVDDGLTAFNAWLEAHLAQLRRSPGDDLLSQLVALEDEGGLDDVELRAIAGLVLAAGFETTVNLLGSGTRLLLESPDQLALLRARPELWPNAVEEALRVESPVQLTGRAAVRTTEVAGVVVPAGRVVTTMLAGANRDPAVFADPHRFDVTRANAKEHLAFSSGRHFCLGAALARAEGEIGLRSLFERFPDLRLAAGARRRRTRVLRGWEVLPVTR